MWKAILNILITLAGIFGPADDKPDEPIPDPPEPIEPPRVNFVLVNPQTVERGKPVIISWEVANAERAWLLVNGKRDRELNLMKGKRKVWLDKSGSLGVVAERGAESARKKKKVIVFEGAWPEDYVPLSQVEEIVFWQSHKWEGLFAYSNALPWQGMRDLNKVASEFPEGAKLLGTTVEELRRLALVGFNLNEELKRILKLIWERNNPSSKNDITGEPIPNRRGGEFRAVTNLRKDAWGEFKVLLLQHLVTTGEFRVRAGECRDDTMSPYDSITGWAEAMIERGYTECPKVP